MEEKLLVAIQDAAITIATPNWSSVVSVFLSLLAIVVAGFVAWKQNKIVLKQAEIAEQQNKIALFEKRYEVFFEITKIVEMYSDPNSTEPINVPMTIGLLEAGLGLKISSEQDRYTMATMATARLLELGHIITQAIFLFPYINETDINNLMDDALNFICVVITSDEEEIDKEDVNIKKFFNSSKDFKQKYFDMIMEKLDLTGGV